MHPAAPVLVVLLAVGCSDGDKGKDESDLWEGKYAGDCLDGADNDGDGLFDCADENCAGAPDCEDTAPDDSGHEETGLEDSGDSGHRETGDSSPDDSGEAASDLDGDGYATSEGDCDDGDENTNPGATDLAGDGLDLNCDGVDGVDADGDGFASTAYGGDDCDDGDAAISPSAVEGTCNGVDDDCNGLPDDGATCDVSVVHGDDAGCESYAHAYLFVSYRAADRLTWEESKSFCEERGYELLTVEDACEWSWVEEVASAFDDGQTASIEWWNGYHCDGADCTSSDDFTYADGSSDYVEWGGNTFAYGNACAMFLYDAYGLGLFASPQPCSDESQTICESPA